MAASSPRPWFRCLLASGVFAAAATLIVVPRDASAAPHHDAVPDGVEIQNDVEIGKGGGVPLYADLSWPKNPEKTPMPALIWVHGGAWTGQSRQTWQEHRWWFSTKGYFTCGIDYRLAGMKGQSIADKAKWPAQIEDCKYGIRWLRANAAKYNVDPDRLAVWGPSAGGHLVGCIGTMDEPRFEGQDGLGGVSSRVQAVIDMCGPEDLTVAKPAGLFGFPYDSNPAAYRDASPLYHVKPGDPPFLVIQGEADTNVPFHQAVNFVNALLEAGNSVEFMLIPGVYHSFGHIDHKECTPEEWKPVQTVMLSFLDRQLKN